MKKAEFKILVIALVFWGLLSVWGAEEREGSGDNNEEQQKKQEDSPEVRKKLDKIMSDKEKDVANCAQSSFAQSKEEQFQISVTIELGPGGKISKSSFKPSQDNEEYMNFAKCVERKFKSASFPNIGENIVTVNRTYKIKKKAAESK
ncbi:MAG: hypothetical protein Kow0090_07800 [Myxococcota bacterium]